MVIGRFLAGKEWVEMVPEMAHVTELKGILSSGGDFQAVSPSPQYQL